MLSALSSLRHRNFRLYLSGQFISLIGTWMQSMALSWMVYRMTKSTFWLGVVTFSSQIPTFVLGLFAGVLVDRVNRHTLLLWTQSLQAIQAAVLAYLTIYGKITLPEIIALGVFLGIVNSVDMPARQAFVVQMVEGRKDLPNAIALSSSVMHGTRLIGPAIAGIMIAALGEGPCFLLNAVSYIAVILALLFMKVNPPVFRNNHENIFLSMRDGLRAAFSFRPIGTILILLSIMSLIGMSYVTLFPALAATMLKGDAHTLGLVTSSSALGGLAAAFFLASRKTVLKLGRAIGASALILALGILALSCTSNPYYVFPLLFCTGFGMMLQMSCGNTLIQTLVDDDKRGRVMSIFIWALLGMSPFGSLLIGAIAEKFGLVQALFLCGGLCLLTAFWFLSRLRLLSSDVRPLYVRLGILTVAGEGSFAADKFVF